MSRSLDLVRSRVRLPGRFSERHRVPRTLKLADARTLDKFARAPAVGPGARVVAGRGGRNQVPVAGHSRGVPGGLAGHRPRRHADHRRQR